VLLNAHFDTRGDSPGAGDDGIGIVSIIEAARALAAGPQLERSVIILRNGGEEYGLYGADGFIRNHPLAQDVRAYLYIDGGPGGAATLLYSGPGTGSLIDAYAASAKRPQADSAYLDLIESGVLSHDGDHRPFRDRGIPGLLFATIGDMWAAHTNLDRFERVESGATQHIGQTVLEVARRLASGDLPHGIEPERSIYFDVLGLFVVHYRAATGVIRGVLSAFLGGLAAWLSWRRRLASVCAIAVAFVAALLSACAALVTAACMGLLLAYVLQRSYSWYGSPWVAYLAFAVPACSAYAALTQRLRARVDTWSVWSASVVGWSSIALLGGLAHARSGYIALAWALGLAVGLLFALRWPHHRHGILLAACTPGLYTVVHFGPMLRTMLAQAGLQPLPVLPDPIIGVLVALLVSSAGAAIALPVLAFGVARTTWKLLAAASLAGVAVSAVVSPFTAERPRRVLVTHAEVGGRSAFLFRARDALPLDPVLEQVSGATPVRGDWPSFEVYEPAPTHEAP
jgi:MFS family permease